MAAILLLIAGSEVILLDQPEPPPHFNVAHDDFSIAVDDPTVFKDKNVQWGSPTISFEVKPDTWTGTFDCYFSTRGTPGKRYASKVSLILPNNARVSPPQHQRFTVTQITESPTYDYVRVDVPILIDKDHPDDGITLSFDWAPTQINRLRLGEDNVILVYTPPDSFGTGTAFPSTPAEGAPFLMVRIDSRTTAFGRVPIRPDMSDQEYMGWRLNESGRIEFSVINRRTRFFADQGVEIIILAAGLLLGLLTTRPRSQQPLISHTEALTTRIEVKLMAMEAALQEMKARIAGQQEESLRRPDWIRSRYLIIGATVAYLVFLRSKAKRRGRGSV